MRRGPRDPATSASAGRFHADYTRFLDPAGLKGARLGIVRNIPGFDDRVVALFNQAVKDLEAAGAVIVDPANLPNLDAGSVFQALPMVVLNYEFKANINAYLASLGPNAPVKTLAELIAFNDAHRAEELGYFGQERLVISEATSGLDAPEYRQAVAAIQRHTRQDGIDALMDQHQLDAIVAPTTGPAWLIDHIRGDRFDGGDSAGTAAIAGYPDISVPMGPRGRPAGGPLVLRPRLERADAAEGRLRLRAGDQAPAAAHLRGHTRLIRPATACPSPPPRRSASRPGGAARRRRCRPCSRSASSCCWRRGRSWCRCG